jgi:hypothetical protein
MRSAEALTGLVAGRMAGRMKIASIASIKWRISQREVDRSGIKAISRIKPKRTLKTAQPKNKNNRLRSQHEITDL